MDERLLPQKCSSERFKIEERIYRGMMRYKGDAEKIAEFLRIQDVGYIREVMRVWQTRMDKDTVLQTAASIATDYLWEFDVRCYFRDQVLAYIMDCIQGHRPAMFSTCCKSTFTTVPATGGSPALVICAKCKGSCDTETLLVKDMIPLMSALLRDSMADSASKLDGLEKVGLGGMSKAPVVQLNDKRQFVNWNTGGVQKTEEISKLDPYDREALRLQLEREIQGDVSGRTKELEVQKKDGGHTEPNDSSAGAGSPSSEEPKS